MCLDCGCENANLLKNNPALKSLNSVDFKELTPLVQKIQVGKDIIHKNDKQASANRENFNRNGLRVFNFMSSPGSGKTTLLCALSEFLKNRDRTQIIVGDLETSIDADRLKKYYSSVQQINTVASCHLDATHLDTVTIEEREGFLFIENIGNLVCPASFDLGEDKRVAVISVTEGEEKPLKYPLLFKDADLCIITKTDLIPHLEFDIKQLEESIKKVNMSAPIFHTSSKTLEGLSELAKWIEGN